MATVTIYKYKGKNKNTYQVYFKHPLTGDKKYFKTYPKQKEAYQAAHDLRALLDSGKFPEKKQKRFNPLTFRKVAYLVKKEWDSKLTRGDLSPKTHYDYCIWLKVLDRRFGDKLLCQITRDDVDIFRNTLASEQTKVTSNRYLFIIKQVFKYALSLNAVIEDPVAEIQAFSEKEHERREFLLPKKLDRLIEVTQKIRAKFYLPAIIYLGAEHGACKQEILDLTWSDIDFDYADIGLIRLFRTKNKRERVEYLMPRTRAALLSWRDHLEQKRKRGKTTEVKSDRVFCRIDGTPIKSFKKAWWAALKKAGIIGFHFHDLRHTFASNLLLSGASLKDVKEMIGHSDISMTDRYSHLTLSHKLQKQTNLADHYTSGARSGVGEK
jgi:integrase